VSDSTSLLLRCIVVALQQLHQEATITRLQGDAATWTSQKLLKVLFGRFLSK
jgi:hypothetical protein